MRVGNTLIRHKAPLRTPHNTSVYIVRAEAINTTNKPIEDGLNQSERTKE